MSNWQHPLTILLRLSVWALGLALGYFVLEYVLPLSTVVAGRLTSYLFPFLLGAMIALLIDPVVDFMTKRTGLSRGISTFITLVLFLGLISVGLIVIISKLVVELLKIAANLPSPQRLSEFFTAWIDLAAPYYAAIHSSPEVVATIQRAISEILVAVKNLMVSGSNHLLDAITALPGFFTILIFGLVASFFFSRDKHLILDLVYRIVPSNRSKQVRRILLEMGEAFMGFVRAQVILISITAILTIVGLYVLGVEYAFTLGIFTGLLDLLPVLGPGLVLLPWIIWELVMGQYALAAKLAILYGLLVMNRQFVEPKVVADSIGLHPLVTLMALYIGLKAFGVVGVIIGPAAVLFFLSMYRAGVFHNHQTR